MRSIIQIVRKWLQGAPEQSMIIPSFLSITKIYLENEIRENSLKKSTQDKYWAFYNNVELFLKTRGQENITPDQVDVALMIEFKSWLHRNLKSCCLTHSAKHIETVKRILDYATLAKHIKFNPISSMKTKRDRTKDIVNLEPEELMRLEKAIFVCDEYYLVRDLYLFQCYTGLSYMDLWRYSVEKNTIEVAGIKKVIELVTCSGGRGKTGKRYWSELSKPAKYIHEKYKGEFPEIDNGKYNRYIKELMNHVGIEKYLTTHTGRKTFATVKDQEGYSMPAIAGMLGNTEQVARTHYVNASKKNILNEIHQKMSLKTIN